MPSPDLVVHFKAQDENFGTKNLEKMEKNQIETMKKIYYIIKIYFLPTLIVHLLIAIFIKINYNIYQIFPFIGTSIVNLDWSNYFTVYHCRLSYK